VARFAVCWVLMICIATAGAFEGTNALLSPRAGVDGYAMQGLTGRRLAECANAARLLAAVGANPNALPDKRRNWDRAARTALAACTAS
jgi:hypothetical protein